MMARGRGARLPDPARSLDDDAVAIARSVLYASLFEYPLTLAQLRQTLIESTQTPTEILATYAGSATLQASVEHRDGFFFPRGQHALVQERRRREARRPTVYRPSPAAADAHIAVAMPYVRMVALSGSVAHLNLEGGGDLDLFIVTRGRRVWSVTVAVLMLAKLLRQRRLLCANFVVSDERLALEQQDLFTASQIIHLKPLAGQDVYRKLLAANPFVTDFYPNFHAADSRMLQFRRRSVLEWGKAMVERLFAWPSAGVERICRAAYRAHLVRQSASWRSPEQVRLEPDYFRSPHAKPPPVGSRTIRPRRPRRARLNSQAGAAGCQTPLRPPNGINRAEGDSFCDHSDRDRRGRGGAALASAPSSRGRFLASPPRRRRWRLSRSHESLPRRIRFDRRSGGRRRARGTAIRRGDRTRRR